MFVLFPVDSCCKIKIQCGWCNRSCNPREIAGSLRVTAGFFISFGAFCAGRITGGRVCLLLDI